MTLYAELTTDPANLGYSAYIATRNDQAIYDLITAKTIDSVRDADFFELSEWILADVQSGETAPILSVQTLASTANALQPFAIGLQVAMNNSQIIQMSNPKYQAGFAAWVGRGITQRQHDSFLAMLATKISRADVLRLSVSMSDISDCLNRGY